MSLDDQYRDLVNRISRSAKALLPAVKPTAKYTEEEVLRVLAFRLLSVAEIEDFLETCASGIVTAMERRQSSTGLPATAKIRLLRHMAMVEKYPPTTLTSAPTSADDTRMGQFLKQHASVIEGNNGASEKDILKLFVPIGFDLQDFDLNWLTSMRELSKRRGETAHKSPATAITIQPDPADERQSFATPLWGLRWLARRCDATIASI
jgi:hypothetical protein